MLDKGAISKTSPRGRGFLSNVFLVSKNGGRRLVILNQYVQTEHFKIERFHVLKDPLQAGDFMMKIALSPGFLRVEGLVLTACDCVMFSRKCFIKMAVKVSS